MATTYAKILVRRGLRAEVTTSTLETGEMGFAIDTNQLYLGTDPAINEIQFDPFANAHATVQSWLDSVDNPEPGLVIDEDLVIRNVVDVDAIFAAMAESANFYVEDFGRSRENVEIVTENTFNQLFADQHLSSLEYTTGLRSSLFRKTFDAASGTFLKYNKEVCTTFFIDYSLVQTNGTDKFLRVGQLKVINGVPQGIAQAKLTDDNTEMWQDDSDGIAEVDEFSNIEFTTELTSTDLHINFTQAVGFITDISYTVKRWSM
ncbi:hypothetical protein N9R43_01590 [bacterium]|nr:hypothetical protein [bacterium]